MKIKSLALSIALLGAVLTGSAQGLDFGLKVGVNALKIQNVSFSDGFNYGWLGGALLYVNLSKKFGVGGEFLLSQATTTPATGAGSVWNSANLSNLQNVKLSYIGIPLLVNIGGKFKLQMGAQFNFKMNESQSLLNNASTAVNNIFKSSDVQALAGVHWNLPIGLFVSGRYLAGISDIGDITNSNSWKSNTIQVGAGIKF